MADSRENADQSVSAHETAHQDVDLARLIELGRRQDKLYVEWGKLVSELHQQKGVSLEVEKHKDDIVRSFACMRQIVATEIGRLMLRD